MSLAIPLLWLLSSASPPGLSVQIEGVHSSTGTLRCTVHNKPEAFPMKADLAVAHAEAPAKSGSAVIPFGAIPPGDYAIACFHDENNDGKLDSNFLHIPTEGVAASNDAKGHFGPPSFADARFHYAGGELVVTVHLAY
jgi:uncharacterized protein (DUF2141 family)